MVITGPANQDVSICIAGQGIVKGRTIEVFNTRQDSVRSTCISVIRGDHASDGCGHAMLGIHIRSGIGIGPAIEVVITRLTVQPVVTGTAAQCVITGTTD